MKRNILNVIMLAVMGLLAHSNAFAQDEANKLELPQSVEVVVGTSTFQLPISLTNGVGITGFQCDLYLPDGFAVATDEGGDYQIDIARTTVHSIAARKMSDGALRIVLKSTTNAAIPGNSGTVLNIAVSVSKEVTVGNYTMNLKNNVLTDAGAVRYSSADVSGTIVIKEQPVTVTAQDLTMVYGDEVPSLTYKSEGAELKGVPSLSCEASSKSPVGTYPIVVAKGSVENKEVTYVNGTLTITKAPLKITAQDYTITQGEAMPTFEVTYEGFKNNETKAVLTKQPTASCTADASSAPGEYPIVVSGAEAGNYYFNYTNGTLTITAKSVVAGDVNDDGTVDISDYIGVANHILGNTPAGFNATAADVNNDGEIDISDYIGVANIILTGKP